MGLIVLILFLMLLVLVISMLVGAVMFCVDIWKWSKRPEKFTTVDEDLKNNNVGYDEQGNLKKGDVFNE